MRRLITLIVWIALPLLLLAPAGLLCYLSFTESGLQQLAARLNGRLGPVTLTISGVRGTLAGGVRLQQLIIDHRRVHIEIDNAQGRLALLPLLWQTIRASDVVVSRLVIRVLPRPDELSAWQPHFLPPFLRIEAERLTVERGQLFVPSGRELDATDMHTTAVLHPMSIRIFGGRMLYSGVTVQADGELRAAAPLAMTAVLRFALQRQEPAQARETVQVRPQPAWTADARIEGDLARLAISGNFAEPFAADFQGEADDLTSGWHWQGHSQVQRFDLRAWGLGDSLGLISGRLQLHGDRNGFHAQGPLTAPGLKFGALDTDFSGSYRDRVLSVAQLTLRHRSAGALLSAAGTVGIVVGGPRLDLHGVWKNFRWPLPAADAPVSSSAGSYRLSGLRPFALAANGQLRVAGLAPINVQLIGRLDTDRLDVDRADVAAFGAHAQLRGATIWKPVQSWQVAGRVEGLDITRLRPGVVGQLNFTAAASGEGFGSAADPIDLRFSDLSGGLRGQRASGQAHVKRIGKDWLFEGVRLTLGATRIEADGRVGSTLDLQFALATQDLGLLQAGARGVLKARGTLRGPLLDPSVVAKVEGHDIVWSRLKLAAIDGTIDFEPHESGRADVQLLLSKLQLADRTLDRLSLHSEGTTAQHQFTLDAQTPALALALAGRGQYREGAWELDISRLDANDGQNMHLRLEAPTKLSLTTKRLNLSELCLRGEMARLCARAEFGSQQREVAITATHLPMRAMTAGLVGSTDFDGTLSVQMQLAARDAQPWRGNLRAELTNAAVHRSFPSGRIETLNLGTGLGSFEFGENELAATLSLDAGEAGSMMGKISARGLGDDWRRWPLRGEFSLDTDALGFIDSYVTQIDRASGRMMATLAVGGAAGAPQLSGELKISNAQLDMYQINLALRAVNFSARLNDNTLAIEGAANAGTEGHADVSGKLSWRDGLIYGDLRLSGKDLRIVNIPEARIDASPDVNVRLDGRRIDVSGAVTLPYARIERSNLANAVLPSSDEMIVGAGPISPQEQFKVFSDITLMLGERVTVDTQGLSGRLSGSLRVSSDDTGISRGTGELIIDEGKYTAYGRKLDIERGRLIFGNGILSDPGMDLRATKKFPDITAGVNVRGTLRQPRMTFFSDPEVSQAQIVSLLLAGGSLESVQNTADSSARNNSARSDLLMQGGAFIGQQIGGRVGIEDVSVESDLTNETSLVLGRYLSPRLYVSYGIGLAEAINTIKLRYTIGDHWTIKTEAGTARSADLVYTVEK